MGKHKHKEKIPRMTLPAIARMILAESGTAMSAHEVWTAAVERGLDRRALTTADRPETTLSAYLYKASKRKNRAIEASGEAPVRFRWTGKAAAAGTDGGE